MTGVTTWNKGTAPAGTEGWNLTANVQRAMETLNVVPPAASATARDALAPPGGKYPGMVAVRTDQASMPLERWDGANWVGGDTGWLSVPLQNSFTDYSDSIWTGLKYRVMGGWCMVNGAVYRATSWPVNQVCGAMPVGARPSHRVQAVNIQVDDTAGYLIMSAGGPGAYSFSATYPVG